MQDVAARAAAQLLQQAAGAADRPGQQGGKEGQEQAQLPDPGETDFATVQGHQIADRLEGIEEMPTGIRKSTAGSTAAMPSACKPACALSRKKSKYLNTARLPTAISRPTRSQRLGRMESSMRADTTVSNTV